jgi:hypothetical protein
MVTIIPTVEDLDRVEAAVDALGGKVLEDICRAEHIHPLGPEVYTCGCGGYTRVVIPYDGPGKYVTLCAVCDAAYLMEKFRP